MFELQKFDKNFVFEFLRKELRTFPSTKPTWSHPIDSPPCVNFHSRLLAKRNHKSMQIFSIPLLSFARRSFGSDSPSAVSLIRRHFGIIKKWSIDNGFHERARETSGSFFPFHGYRLTRNILIAFFDPKIWNGSKKYSPLEIVYVSFLYINILHINLCRQINMKF